LFHTANAPPGTAMTPPGANTPAKPETALTSRQQLVVTSMPGLVIESALVSGPGIQDDQIAAEVIKACPVYGIVDQHEVRGTRTK